MRNFHLLTFILLFGGTIIVMASCKKATFLTVDNETITVDNENITSSFVVHSDGTDISVVSSSSWILAVVEDSVLHYNVCANQKNQPRKGEIIVACGDLQLTINIVQQKAATRLSVSPTNLEIPKQGGTLTVKVDTDADSVNVDAPAGITTKYENGTLTLTATPEAAAAGGQIVLSASKLQATVAYRLQPDDPYVPLLEAALHGDFSGFTTNPQLASFEREYCVDGMREISKLSRYYFINYSGGDWLTNIYYDPLTRRFYLCKGYYNCYPEINGLPGYIVKWSSIPAGSKVPSDLRKLSNL